MREGCETSDCTRENERKSMSQSLDVVIHLKDLVIEDHHRESIERRCEHLAEEFPEVDRVEISVHEDGADFQVHGHATGKNTDTAAHDQANEVVPAVDSVLDKLKRHLRKAHDKRIFAQRRDAQRHPPKRSAS
jgi:ribosomal subunit interface protein